MLHDPEITGRDREAERCGVGVFTVLGLRSRISENELGAFAQQEERDVQQTVASENRRL